MMQTFVHICSDYTFQKIIMGTFCIGFISGLLGIFTFLRQQSLLSDTISHAALPGVAMIFLCTHSTNPWVLFFGGFIAGIIGVAFVNMLSRKTTLKKDAALGIVLSVFFGLGLILLTIIQKYHMGGNAFLHRFLFGDASTLLTEDIYCIVGIGLVACAVVVMMWKEFKIVTFDPLFAQTIGFSVVAIELILMTIIVSVIVIGLQMVGVILTSALCIASSVAARQLTYSMERMALLSALCGACSSVCGSIISCMYDTIPTGPMINLCALVLVMVAFIIGSYKPVVARNYFS